jgi:hypothetical protein
MPRSTSVNSYNISYAASSRTVQQRSRTESLSLVKLTLATVLNFALAGIAATLLLAYVLNANKVTANQYLMKALDEKVLSLSDERMTLIQQQVSLADEESLATLAQSLGMVETGDISYIFESNTVAYRR